jgi:hypothetical protein
VDDKKHRWRKATDIERKHSLFELIVNEEILLDVGFSDQGDFEISFNSSVSGKSFDWAGLQDWIAEGKQLAEMDR